MHIPFCFQSFAVPIFRTQLEKHKNYAISYSRRGYSTNDKPMNRSEISTQQLDHLGIVAGICQQIDLIVIR